jgi:hypothetical protein
MAVISGIRVGKPDVEPSLPSHTPGVREGNEPGSLEREAGISPNGRATAERSTGINPKHKNPIDPSMPVLTPA